MALEVIPESLYTLKNLRPILSDGRSSILRKTLGESLINMGKFISTSLIVYIVRGRQIISDQQGMDNVIEEGHLIFLPKDVYFVSDFVASHGVFEAMLFFVDDKLIDKYLRTCPEPVSPPDVQDPSAGPRRPYALPASKQVKSYVDSLNEVYTGGANSAALLEIKLLELLHLIALQDRSMGFIHALSNDKHQLKRRCITEFMETYYVYNLKVEEYAVLTGRSLSTFMRDFKKAYDTTPNQWLIDKRLDISHRMLVEQNVSVRDAALEAGYENVSHFIRAYKRKFGVTPKKAKETTTLLVASSRPASARPESLAEAG